MKHYQEGRVVETFADEQLKESSPQTLLRFGMGGGNTTIMKIVAITLKLSNVLVADIKRMRLHCTSRVETTAPTADARWIWRADNA